jgi:3-oxoacyl-(acyl-carrier-protein) synthase
MEILITGLGAITPRGDFTLHSPPTPREGDGSLSDFDLKNYLSTPKTYLDRCSALALAGCALALEDAGLEGQFDEQFGFSLGTEFGCVETMRGFEAKLAESGARAVSPLLFSHSYFNSPASLCVIEWGLKGYHATFCGPEAGWDAVATARDALLLGHANRMLCGAVDALSPARGWGDEENNPSEASVFLVLEATHGDRAGQHWGEVFGEEDPAATDRFGRCGAVLSLLKRLRLAD